MVVGYGEGRREERESASQNGRCLKVSSNAAGEVATTSDPFLGHISATTCDKLHQRPYRTGPVEAISAPLCGKRRQRNEEKHP